MVWGEWWRREDMERAHGERGRREEKNITPPHPLVHAATWMLRLLNRRRETQPCPPRAERDLTQAVSGQGKQSHQFCLVTGSCGSSSSTSNTFLFLLSDKVILNENLLTGNRARQVTEHLAVSRASRCLCVIWYLVSLAGASKEFCQRWKSKSYLYFPAWRELCNPPSVLDGAELTLSPCTDHRVGWAQDPHFPHREMCSLRNCCTKSTACRRQLPHG